VLRRFLVAAVLVLAPVFASAEVSVVKIINFTCPYCRSSEALDPPLKQAAEATGGRFVYATIPTEDPDDSARELVYYAARHVIPEHEPFVRASLYKGAQDLGYPLATAAQTVEWLATDLARLNIDWTKVLQASGEKAALDAYQRALRLTVRSGAQVLPTYVLVKDGEVLRTLDVEAAGNYASLREAVLTAIEKSAGKNSPTKPIK
jgi:protein-disulfide isomerase